MLLSLRTLLSGWAFQKHIRRSFLPFDLANFTRLVQEKSTFTTTMFRPFVLLYVTVCIIAFSSPLALGSDWRPEDQTPEQRRKTQQITSLVDGVNDALGKMSKAERNVLRRLPADHDPRKEREDRMAAEEKKRREEKPKSRFCGLTSSKSKRKH